MPSFASQLLRLRQIVISANKQNTYGTALLDAALVHNLRFKGDAFPGFPQKQFFSDFDLAKGFPWPTFRIEIERKSMFGISGMAVYDFVAGWLGAFTFGKVVTTGAGPFTHVFTPDLSTTLSPVTTLWMQDTADVKTRYPDLAITSLMFKGAAIGPVLCDFQMIGSGRSTEASALTAPALVTPTFILNNDADILLGTQGAPVSIKERIRSWDITITVPQEDYRHPGSGKFAGFHRRGDLAVDVKLAIAAKDVDDIRTLILADTIQELQINVNSGAAAQLNFKFPAIILKGVMAADGQFGVWNVEASGDGVLKSGSNEVVVMTVINNQATWLVGA